MLRVESALGSSVVHHAIDLRVLIDGSDVPPLTFQGNAVGGLLPVEPLDESTGAIAVRRSFSELSKLGQDALRKNVDCSANQCGLWICWLLHEADDPPI